jgi:hypothetical protein
MKTREANLNIMVLTAVLLFSLVISGVAALFERRTSPADRKLLSEPLPVRVVGPVNPLSFKRNGTVWKLRRGSAARV